MFLKKGSKGYYELYEWRDGKRRYVKYIGKDPQPFLEELARGREILAIETEYPAKGTHSSQSAAC